MAMFKEAFAKNKTGEMAYNIGVMLAKEAKTNPAVTNDAIKLPPRRRRPRAPRTPSKPRRP